MANSHIIPRSFYELLGEDWQASRVLENRPDTYPKRSPIGIYDPGILCVGCEATFSIWDDYGYRFLIKNPGLKPITGPMGIIFGQNLGQCDPDKLLMFFLSILWRAHYSTQGMFDWVKLGPYANRIKELIEAGGGASADTRYAVALARFDADPGEVGMLCPDRTAYDGVNHYRLYLGNYMAVVKVSNQPGPEVLQKVYVRAESPVYVVNRDLRSSKEFVLMKKILSQPGNDKVLSKLMD